MQPSRKVLVLVPAYNEEGRLCEVLAQIRAAAPPGSDLLVVDDGSSDQTAKEAREAGAIVARLPVNLGAGGALQTGYLYALRFGYDALVQLDADGQHDPAHIPELLEALAEADLVVGSRFLEKASYSPPWAQRIGMWLFSRIATLLSGTKVTDSTSGYRAMSRRALSFLAHERYPADYPDADTLAMVSRAGLRLKEVPVRMRPSPPGKRPMHAGIAVPVYYVLKVSLALALVPLRREKP